MPSGSRAVTRPNIGSVAKNVPSAPKMASSGPTMPPPSGENTLVLAGLDVDRGDLRAEHLRHVEPAVGPDRHAVAARQPARPGHHLERRSRSATAAARSRTSASDRSCRHRPPCCATKRSEAQRRSLFGRWSPCSQRLSSAWASARRRALIASTSAASHVNSTAKPSGSLM